MIALPPVDPADFIMKSGDELQNCIREYFTEITLEDATRGEILDPKYSPELLGKLQAEYRSKLKHIWDVSPLSAFSTFQAAYKMPPLEVAGDLEVLQKAYDAAVKRTLWEKLGNNYKDVVEYKNLLKNYCEGLLWTMQNNFVDAVAKTAGR